MFNLNDLVNVPGRPDLTNYGTIMELRPDGKALVRFRTPRKPMEYGTCDDCGLPGMLSQNSSTGEIVCMSFGCGHEHGFVERDEELPLGTLVNITAQRREKRKEQFRARLNDLLEEGVSEEFITPEVSVRILQAV